TTYVPVALGPRTETVELTVTRQPACSSIYPPLTELIERIPALVVIEPESTMSIDLEPLDDWCAANDVGHVDVLKVDTQGSELGVFEGATKALSTCVLVESEVEFNPIYSGQPLFADVDAFLRSQGFVLWRLDNFAHYTDSDVIPRLDGALTIFTDATPREVRIGGGQLYWADAFYVRADLCGPADALDPAYARRAARIARAAGFPDLAARILPSTGDELVAEADEARLERERQRRRERRAARAARAAAAPAPPRRSFARRVVGRLLRR
ncbi:MAG: methyltransferase, FkbM family domain protein, partial [Nocardioidaceae bacterium]|nr:methyltransferase, FkbM family domain protein [Nocardioidaceae bacterium]